MPDVPDPSSISSGGPDRQYGKLAGDLAVARHIFSGNFKEADLHVEKRRQSLENLPRVKESFENLVALLVRSFLAEVSTSLSPKNAAGWQGLDSAFSTYDWLGAQRAYVRRPEPVFSFFVGARFWLVHGIILILLIYICLAARKSDRMWSDRMLGNAFAEDDAGGPTGKSGSRGWRGAGGRTKYNEDEYIYENEGSGDAPGKRSMS